MSKPKLLNLDMMSLQNIDEDSDLIPLMTSDDEEAISKESLPLSLSILPLKKYSYVPRYCYSYNCIKRQINKVD